MIRNQPETMQHCIQSIIYQLYQASTNHEFGPIEIQSGKNLREFFTLNLTLSHELKHNKIPSEKENE